MNCHLYGGSVVLDEHSMNGAFTLMRVVAPTRHNFWDPAGPPAPFNRDLVCIPEVSDRVWVSQCIPRVYHTCCKAVSFTLQFLVFCTAMLCACDSCSFTTEDHIRCFVNLFCCIRTSDDFTKFVAWYSLYVALIVEPEDRWYMLGRYL